MSNGDFSLLAACQRGDLPAVKKLVEKGASLTTQDKFGMTCLHAAAFGGHSKVLTLLLQCGGEELDEEGQTPLHLAAREGRLGCVQALVKAGVKLDVKDGSGRTPLWQSSAWGHTDILKYLISLGADSSLTNDHGRAPSLVAANPETAKVLRSAEALQRTKVQLKAMLHAAKGGDSVKLQQLIRRDGADPNSSTENGTTPLHRAARHGNVDCIQILLQANANANAATITQLRPIHHAAWFGSTRAIDLLVSHNAEVNVQDKDGWSPLFTAVVGGWTDAVRYLGRAGADPNLETVDGWTALHRAAADQRVDIADLLLRLGADEHALTRKKETPLDLAKGTVKTALQEGEESRLKRWEMERVRVSRLFEAAASGDLATMRKELEVSDEGTRKPTAAAARALAAKNPQGWGMIHVATQAGHEDIIKLVVSLGGPIGTTGGPANRAYQPIHIGASVGRADTVKTLIGLGASVDAVTGEGQTALLLAAGNGHVQVLECLLDAGAVMKGFGSLNRQAIHMAASANQVDAVQFLLDRGASVMARDRTGSTPLHLAASAGHVAMVESLLNNSKCHIDARNGHGATALHLAAAADQEDVVRVLNKFNADTSLEDCTGALPFDVAATESIGAMLGSGVKRNDPNDKRMQLIKAAVDGNLAVVQSLLKEVSPSVRDEDNWSPLHWAARWGHTPVVETLLANSANVSLRGGPENWTPLCCAAWAGHSAVVEVLLESGASVDQREDMGLTPLMLSAEEGHIAIAEQLIKAGSSPHSTSLKGRGLLHIAAAHGHADFVECLLPLCEVNAQDCMGETALHVAASAGHGKLVSVLLKGGAEVEIENARNALPVDVSASKSITELLSEDQAARNKQWLKEDLLAAATGGDLQRVVDLLRQGADPNGRDPTEGWAPIHFAAGKGHCEIVRRLLANGSDANLPGNSDWTALHCAAWTNQCEVVKLVAAIPRIHLDAKNRDGVTPLMCASRKGHTDIIELLLKHNDNAKMMTVQSNEGWTALHHASAESKVEAVEILLWAGSDANAQDNQGWTCLHWAASRDHLEVAERLILQGGASVEITNKKGETAVKLAATEQMKELIASSVQERSQKKTVNVQLLEASLSGDMDAIMEALSGGADVNCRDSENWTPLCRAVRREHLQVVSLLLEHHCDVNAVGRDGWTALHTASWTGNVQEVGLLLKKGAKVNAVNQDGITALMCACRKGPEGYTAIADELLQSGADCSVVNAKDGMTALTYACQLGHKEVAMLLIERGAQVDQYDKYGRTPLIWSARRAESLNVTKALIKAGANVDACSDEGRSALFEATRKNHVGTIGLLLDCGADPDLGNPYMIARSDEARQLIEKAKKAKLKSKEKEMRDLAKTSAIASVMKLLAPTTGIDVNSRDEQGRTALHGAVDSLPMVEALLDAGANPLIRDADGQSATDLSTIPDVVACLTAAVERKRAKLSEDLLIAAAHDDVGRVVALIEIGGNVNHQDSQLWTPLMWAVNGNLTKVMTSLLELGASVQLRNRQGQTAIHLASEKNHATALEILLAHETDVNASDDTGCTALHVACRLGHINAALKLLKSGGCDVDAVNMNGDTSLHLAAGGGHGAVCELLIREHAARDVMNKDGRLAVDVASGRRLRGLLQKKEKKSFAMMSSAYNTL